MADYITLKISVRAVLTTRKRETDNEKIANKF